MPVPTKMQDLALTAASNFPTGGEAIGTSLDDYLRSHGSILKSTASISSSTIASAATTDLASSDAEQVSVTGTTTITSLGTGFAGCYREVLFTGALQLTHSAALLLPNATNITTAANDVIAFRCLTAGNWIMVGGSRASANFANVNLTGTSTYNGTEIGFRGVPQTVRNANYTFVADDKGRCSVKNDSNPYTYTVNTGVHAAGDVVTVLNSGGGGNVTIAQGAGVTLYLAGSLTTGNRTVVPGGVATIYFDLTNRGWIGGPGVS